MRRLWRENSLSIVFLALFVAAGAIADEGDPSPHTGHEDNSTPGASADDVERMEDAPAQQNANPGAAVEDQGFGQHDDQDATDVETKQSHPATPADMGNR